MSTASKTTSADTSNMSNQIETLRNELSTLTQTVKDFGATKGAEAVSAAKLKASGAVDAVADQAETARLHGMMMQDDANDFIKRQPATAIGIAVGLGFLVGFLGSRR